MKKYSEKTESLKTIIHGSICDIEYIILPRHNVLLGLDWFNKTKASIQTYNQSLIFSSRIVPLVDNKVEDEINLTEINICNLNRNDEEDLDEDHWDLVKEIIPIASNPFLNDEENKKFKNLINKYNSLFANSLEDLDKPYTQNKFVIKTMEESPITIYPYRKSYKEKETIQKEVDLMLKANIIRTSRSPWSFPVILVPKPDNTERFCIDYRRLNKITIKDPYPMPRIDDIFAQLSGSEWFSKIDLKSGYWQVAMDENSIQKTAFSTPDGHYEFLRLPFGLRNAPAEFSRIMFQQLGDLKCVQIYIDDIIVHSKDLEKHFQDIEIV